MKKSSQTKQTSTSPSLTIEHLYRDAEFKKTLFIIAFGLTHQEETAYDIVQESFLKALERANFLKENPRGYIYRIVRSRSIDWYRSRQVQLSYIQTFVENNREEQTCLAIQLFENQQFWQEYIQQIHLDAVDKQVLDLWQKAYTNQEIIQKLPHLKDTREVARIKQNIKRRLLRVAQKSGWQGTK